MLKIDKQLMKSGLHSQLLLKGFITLLIFIFPFFHDQIFAQTESEKFFASGFGKYQNKDYYGALIDYTLAIKNNPDNYKLYLCRSIVYIELEEYKNALIDLDSAMKYEINDAEVYFYLAYIDYKKNNFKEAIIRFDRAVNLKPDYAEAYYYKAVSCLNTSDTSLALSCLDTAVAIAPNEFMYYFKRARIHFLQNNYYEAQQDFQQCVKIKPTSAEAWYNLGYTQYKLKDVEAACNSWYEASRLGNAAARKAIVNYCR